ncbi:hypothetical protein C0J52_12879 [Blattella germanica]|nr:hypothetical protein C0J52_12879 [Blattella germanica]
MAVALEPSAVENKDSSIAARGKRTLEFFPPVPRSYGAAERRISTGPTATSRVAISTHYFDRGTPPITIRHQTRVPTHHANGSNRRTRPHSVPAPPYAVQMEPLVQYSQRDPLYHQQKQASSGKTSDQSSFNDLQQVKKSSAPVLSLEHPPKSQHVSSSELSLAALPTSIEQETSRTDHDLTNQIPRDELLPFHDSEPSAGQFASQHLYPYEDSPYYLREPEPIIEIIVKESNVTLPPAPTPPTPPSRPPTKEPVQVFYVKYKKESSKYGKEGGIIYDPPIPAVTPASNSETEAHYPASSEVSTHPPTPPPPPPPTTTLRTIIRPDSETFHGSGLHVTFGDPNDEESHEDYQQQSAPHPSVIFPQQNFNLRKSVGPSQRPSFLPPHEHHKRQPEPFQQQPPVSLHQPQHHPFNQQHQQNQFPPHQPPFQRPFNPPPFHQQRQPPFQQPPHLSQPPPTFNQPPAPFRHLPPPPPQHPPSQKPNFHQSFKQPPFPFQPPRQQPPPQSPSQNNQRPPHIQIQHSPEDEKKTQTALAALPDEVPEDLRQQLLSSGILSNADIQILDYDKVGDIPIENLPPHALENFYGAAGSVGAASAPVPQVVALNDSKTPVEMKVVRFDPATAEGQEVAEKYVRNDATQVDPVVLNDSKYNRYLPLKVNGAQFPVPDVPELRGRNVTSVVVLAPVDYDFRKPNHTADDSDREGRSTRVEVQGVQFVAGDVLKELVKEPTVENYKKWLAKENSTEADRQSIVLLVVGANDGNSKDIYMYDVGTQKVSRLRGELSSAFVEVAEANANSQELGSVAAASENWQESPFDLEPSAAASEIQEQIVLPAGVEVKDLSSSLSTKQIEVPAKGDLIVAASDAESTIPENSSGDKISNTILVSSGYSKTSDFTGPAL